MTKTQNLQVPRYGAFWEFLRNAAKDAEEDVRHGVNRRGDEVPGKFRNYADRYLSYPGCDC